MTDSQRDQEWKAGQSYTPEYLQLWRDAIDKDATEYVYWHGHVPDWWPCKPDGTPILAYKSESQPVSDRKS